MRRKRKRPIVLTSCVISARRSCCRRRDCFWRAGFPPVRPHVGGAPIESWSLAVTAGSASPVPSLLSSMEIGLADRWPRPFSRKVRTCSSALKLLLRDCLPLFLLTCCSCCVWRSDAALPVNECPTSCSCSVDFTSVDCASRNFTNFADKLPDNTQRV